jgi:hypothetical protein
MGSAGEVGIDIYVYIFPRRFLSFAQEPVKTKKTAAESFGGGFWGGGPLKRLLLFQLQKLSTNFPPAAENFS